MYMYPRRVIFKTIKEPRQGLMLKMKSIIWIA